jgi:hypothetical protein
MTYGDNVTVSFQDDSHADSSRMLAVFSRVASADPELATNIKSFWQHGGTLTVCYHTKPDRWLMEEISRAWSRVDMRYDSGRDCTVHCYGEDEIEVRP